jgi:hypothetical protein
MTRARLLAVPPYLYTFITESDFHPAPIYDTGVLMMTVRLPALLIVGSSKVGSAYAYYSSSSLLL